MQEAGSGEQTRAGVGIGHGSDTGEHEWATGRDDGGSESGGGGNPGAFNDDIEAVEHPRRR